MLADYFQTNNVVSALDAYAVAVSPPRLNWPVDRKLQLYAWAKEAFDSDRGERERFDAFNSIYEELRSFWRVFRNPGRGYWDATTIYEALLRECGPISRSAGLTLRNIDVRANDAMVVTCLRRLRNLKQTSEYPHMAIAKFLHFFNPRLFPIYDGAVIWGRVLWGGDGVDAAFRSDYDAFCNRRRFRQREDDARFNLNYVLLASETLRRTDPDATMRIFLDWVVGRWGDAAEPRVLAELSSYYATAFEFITIGAAEIELQRRGLGGV